MKKNSELRLINKIIVFLLVVSISFTAIAAPTGVVLEAGLPEHNISAPAWCYNNEANAILMTAPEREREKCKLELEFELGKQKAKYELKIANLQLRIETENTRHIEILNIKNKEIEQLTDAALKRPNQHGWWFVAGGFAVGVGLTVLIGWMAFSAQNGFQL